MSSRRQRDEDRAVMVGFDREGNHIPRRALMERLKPAEEFFDTLTFFRAKRTAGRSAAMRWTFYRASSGTTVTFSNRETAKLLPLMERGSVTGWFTFKRDGQATTCTLLEKHPDAVILAGESE